MKEAIERTIQDLGFAAEGLNEALGKANNVEAIIVLDIIGAVAETRRKAEALLNAHMIDTKGKK